MSDVRIISVNAENVGDYGFCGYKSMKQEGYRRKTEWLKKRFKEGMGFKILYAQDEGAIGFIEYIPGEYSWRPAEARGYMVIHCIMIHRKKYKGKGYGALLLAECQKDTKKAKLNGMAAVTSKDTWMAGKELFLRNGFESVDTAPPSFELLVKKIRRAPSPKFPQDWKKRLQKYGKGLVIIRSDQCPCIAKFTEEILEATKEFRVKAKVVELKNCKQAQMAPSAYGMFNIVHNGELIADHPISRTRFINIMKIIMNSSPSNTKRT